MILANKIVWCVGFASEQPRSELSVELEVSYDYKIKAGEAERWVFRSS